MTTKDREELLNLTGKFLNDNNGNRINEWLGTIFVNSLKSIIDKIVERDNRVIPDKKIIEKK